MDDTIIEVNWAGEIIWEWITSDHFNEFDWTEEARNILSRNPNVGPRGDRQAGDWMHLNSISTLGPNNWYDSGDTRFHPDNIIWCARESNITAIIDKKTGKIVWEYVNPFWSQYMNMNKIYRAYRLPYGWIPQLDPPKELPVEPVDLISFRVPGAATSGIKEETIVKGALPFPVRPDICIDKSE